MKSKIIFGDDELRRRLKELKDFNENKLYEHIAKALKNLEEDAFCGIQLPKYLIPKEYLRKFGNLTNLWKYNLPDAWRLIYTVKNDSVNVISVILEWMNHREYERRFNY